MNRAVFFDRDGVINELVYHQEQEVIDSPFTPGQFKLIPGVTNALKTLHGNNYLNILVSNQPGIAKGHMSLKNFKFYQTLISPFFINSVGLKTSSLNFL